MTKTEKTHLAYRIFRRIERVREMERNDVSRFKPNPFGPGYLTRYERYTEVLRELHRRLDQANG